MPQIDNNTFFPQVLNSFLMILIFFLFFLKSINLLIASLLKIRLRLLSILMYEYSFKPFINFIYYKYHLEFYNTKKSNLIIKPLFLKTSK